MTLPFTIRIFGGLLLIKKKNLPVPIDDISKALRLEANLDECSVQTSQIKNTPQSTEIFNEIVLMFKNPSLTEYINVE